ncbi:MAG TPA: tetratricopeptide repeat protein, partial [Spirochaetota bacterium]|nr:tetratricopeptide repeat protein [Spirochaetota bacterium]
SNIRMKRATCYYFTREYERAIEDLEFVRKYRKRSIQPLLLLSALQIKQGHYDDAIKNLQRAHSLDNNNNEVLFQLGSLYYRNKDEKYISYFNSLFNRYSQKKPEDTPAKYLKAFQLLAHARYESEQYKNVIAVTSWLPESSMDYDMRLIAAHSHYNLKEYQAAINNFEKISLNTDDSLTLCRAYARAEFPNKAITLLKSLYYNPSVRDKAVKDPLLKKLVDEIENKKSESTETPTITEKESDQPGNIREVPRETVDTEITDPGDSSEEKIEKGDENITDVQNKQQSPE